MKPSFLLTATNANKLKGSLILCFLGLILLVFSVTEAFDELPEGVPEAKVKSQLAKALQAAEEGRPSLKATLLHHHSGRKGVDAVRRKEKASGSPGNAEHRGTQGTQLAAESCANCKGGKLSRRGKSDAEGGKRTGDKERKRGRRKRGNEQGPEEEIAKRNNNKRRVRRAASRLKLTNGLFEGVVVKISDRISQEDCRDVIQGLQASLHELSSSLHLATDGRAGFGTITVIVPGPWSSRACHTTGADTPSQYSLTSQDAHIHVELPHALFGDAPWTQQSSGCGRHGDFISMGVTFLKEANSSSELATRAGRVLAGEWAKFRWGVFSEIGYSGDLLYPPWYLEDTEWAPTLCSDVSSHSLPCHPELSHRCPWPPKALANASSSLLSTPNLPQVNLFCTKRTHNVRAPTKQNTLCRGRSAWDIIAASEDFSGGRNPPGINPIRPPEIVFVKPSPLRFVLLVEDTAVMNEQRRWEFVRKAVRRTVVYDLPDEAHVSLVVFNAETTEVAPVSKLESVSDLRERVGSSLPRNPSSVRASQACVKCAIEAAIKVLKAADVNEKGANIVLLTAGGQSRTNEVEDVANLIQAHGLRLILVLYPFQEYPGRPAPSHALVPIARGSGGSVFTVMDEGVGNDSKVSMLIALMEALTAAVASGGAATPVLVHLATYPGGVASLSTGVFSLDDSLGANAKFAVYYYDLNHVGNTIHLTAPSGSTFASVSMQEEDGDVNMIFVNLHNAERGVWRYKVENRADSHQGLHIQVTSLPNPANDVKVRAWTNQNTDLYMMSPRSDPIIIYGEVKVSGSPVLEAGVMAILQRLGTNATGGTYPPIKVPLLDLGTGDPDITKGDGIYSRYAPPLEGPAKYSLVLSVDASRAVIGQAATHAHAHVKEHDHRHHRHAYVKEQSFKKALSTSFPVGSSAFSYGLASSITSSFYSYYENPSQRGWENGGTTMGPSGCCGSVLQYHHTRQAPPFTRQVTGPTVDSRVEYSPRKDTTPPARISDLIAWVNSSTGLVVMEWTSVGSDYDWGRAHHYEGAYTFSLEQAIVQCSGHALRGLPDPSPAATRETASVSLDVSDKKTIYVCVRAVDKAGNKGPPGNAAAVWLPRPPAIDRVTVRARGSGFGNYGSSGVGEKAAVISGIIGGILLVVVLVASYCYCVPVAFKKRLKGRRRETNDLKGEEKVANGTDGNLINGGSVMMKSMSRKSVFTSNVGGAAGENRRNNSRFGGSLLASPVDVSNRGEQETAGGGGSQETLKLSAENNDGVNCQSSGFKAMEYLAKEDSLNEERRALSMSIPDVTRVDPQKANSPKNNNQSHNLQFFTLGRNPNRTPTRNPYFEMVHTDFQHPSSQSPHFDPAKESPLAKTETKIQTGPPKPPPLGVNPFMSVFRPATPTRRQSMHESDSSLYGSQEGDSVTGVLICDDRTSSPPPPAPSGPADNGPALAFRMNRHSAVYP